MAPEGFSFFRSCKERPGNDNFMPKRNSNILAKPHMHADTTV